MYEKDGGGRCVAAIGSMTQAIAAQRILNREGVFSEVEGVDPTRVRRGCSYGVSFPCGYEKRVRELLGKEGVRVRVTYGVNEK